MHRIHSGLLFLSLCLGLSGCLIRKGDLPRIEDFKPDSVEKTVPLELDFKQVLVNDGTYVYLSEKLAEPLREDTIEAIESLKAVDITDGATDFKLSVKFTDVSGHNFLWSMISSSTLFLVPYHGSNAYQIEAELKWKDKLVRSYDIADTSDVWAHVLLVPVGIFRWPRTVNNIQVNMLRTLAVQVTSDIRNFIVSSH